MGRSDLIVLTADDNAKQALEGLLTRHAALGMRPIRTTFYVHPERDPGCRLRGHDFLRAHASRFEHALIVFDREGCGRDSSTALALATEVETNLRSNGWGDRAAAIVCDPEVDGWVWSRSPHVEEQLGWKGRSPTLRDWLLENDFLKEEEVKPARPKEALEAALRIARKPRSSALYGRLAKAVSFHGCVDAAFLKLQQKLAAWFPLA